MESSSYLLQCGVPTAIGGLSFARDIIAANVALRLALQYWSPPAWARHGASLALGTFLLYGNAGFAFLWTAALTAGSYFCLMALTLARCRRRGLVTAALVALFPLAAEWAAPGDAAAWHRIRGVQMIAAMKIASVALDLDGGLAAEPPGPAAYAGYVFCPANCVLGPWTSFRRYERSLERKYLDRRWVWAIAKNLCLAMLYLFLSNCLVPWYISDEYGAWARAYRDAQAFRASHYFVSTLSEAFAISGCHGDEDIVKKGWSAPVAEPLRVEFPRSLVRVVVAWNAPMHRWLKRYAFDACRPLGAPAAVFATYAVSALLHGANFQLAAALLSVGAFSYVEYKFRARLADALGMCCAANACPKGCAHECKASAPSTVAVNVALGLLATFHLAYLGVMFEASFAVQETGYSYAHALNKWAELNFASHAVALVTYLIYLVI